MLSLSRRPLAAACLLCFSTTVAACGGHSSPSALPPTLGPTAPQSNNTAGNRATESVANTTIGAPPHPVGSLAVSDLGRRNANATVRAAVTLAYNHQAELDRLVAQQADPSSPTYHHFLTTSQFNDYYAPTPAQEAAVVHALQTAGFTITQRFANRTIVDATAPSSAVEHFFNTEMHTLNQGKFGQRFTNVKPATLPSSIASYVKDVSLNNVIVLQRQSQVAQNSARRSVKTVLTPPKSVPTAIHPMVGNVVLNPGFETGNFSSWSFCGSSSMPPTVSTNHPHSGYYSARMGSTNSSAGEPYGDSGICQYVTIPSSGTLTFWVYRQSDEANTAYAWQEADLLDAYGHRVVNFYYSVNNYTGWVQKSYNLSAYAGKSYWLYFGVHGDGYPLLYTWQYVDDVNLSGTGTPTPSPSPSRTATPSPKPTSTPSSGCNGAAALNGPLSNSNGWLATGVAKAFDYPTQHGCNGAGQTVAVEIDTPIDASDVSTYLSAAGVTQTGSITNVAVDGGGNAFSSDYLETALDVETISGLAPGANIRVYNFPDLSDQSAEDGYNQAVSDGIASVVNSSFGQCESTDTSFANVTNSIAQQAASKGMTFSASSGDQGSNMCSGSLGVITPAGDPYFVSVGAVDFTSSSTGALASITAGSDVTNNFQSGGGVSTVLALPSYQSGISGMISSGRNQPDVSLPGVGAAIYGANFGGWMKVDGTSWSSPEFVALTAEANQLHNTHFGFVTPALYSVFKNSGYTDYTDVTSGTNGAYNAVTGYDHVTGIGAPKAWALANAL